MTFDTKYPLDYTPNGDTVDDFARKYMQEIKEIYKIVNAMVANKIVDGEASAGQLNVDDGKLYIRNNDNSEWTLIGDINEKYLGLHEAGFLSKEDLNTIVPKIDEETGLINVGTTGNAGKICGYVIKTTDIKDGEVLAYRASVGAFVNETKASVGGAKSLIVNIAGVNCSDYNGSATTELALPAVVVSEEYPLSLALNGMWIKKEV